MRYTYLAGDIKSMSTSHNNLGIYLNKLGSSKGPFHHLADALIDVLSRSGQLPTSLRNLSIDLAKFGPEALPTSFDQLCETVEEVEGVKFRELFLQLAGPDADGDEVMKAVLQMAKEMEKGEEA